MERSCIGVQDKVPYFFLSANNYLPYPQALLHTQPQNKIIMESFIIFILIGAAAGWLAGQIMKGSGFGLLWNIVIGIVGGLVGGWLFGELGIAIGSGIVNAIITSVAGAVVVLFVAGMVKKMMK